MLPGKNIKENELSKTRFYFHANFRELPFFGVIPLYLTAGDAFIGILLPLSVTCITAWSCATLWVKKTSHRRKPVSISCRLFLLHFLVLDSGFRRNDAVLMREEKKQFILHDPGRKNGQTLWPARLHEARVDLRAVIHIEFDRMRRCAETIPLFLLQRDIAVDHVLGKHIPGQKEFIIGLKRR